MTQPTPTPPVAAPPAASKTSSILDFVHATTSNRQVNTLSRAILAAVVAAVYAYLKSQGYA